MKTAYFQTSIFVDLGIVAKSGVSAIEEEKKNHVGKKGGATHEPIHMPILPEQGGKGHEVGGFGGDREDKKEECQSP